MVWLADEITVSIGGEAIELRPSLRFAIRLERRPGGFPQLAREITEGSLTAAVDIIRDHVDTPFLENRVFDALPDLQGSLLSYLTQCAGIDPDQKLQRVATDEAKAKKIEPVTFREYLTGLYRIGTGWLGWTPETTLDATPAEITEAYTGLMEKLRAIYGSAEKAQEKTTVPFTDANVRGFFARNKERKG